MNHLTRSDLYSLEQYAEKRAAFKAEVLAHKKPRRLSLGEHATFYFENRLTIQYQIQEMLRIEKIFESKEIQEELDAYNPLVPDGNNWKATFMLEYTDPDERQQALAQLVGIEHKVHVNIDGFPTVTGIADEDLERSTDEKTSAVHFMRFEFSHDMVTALKQGATCHMSIDHDNYQAQCNPIPSDTLQSLIADFS